MGSKFQWFLNETAPSLMESLKLVLSKIVICGLFFVSFSQRASGRQVG